MRQFPFTLLCLPFLTSCAIPVAMPGFGGSAATRGAVAEVEALAGRMSAYLASGDAEAFATLFEHRGSSGLVRTQRGAASGQEQIAHHVASGWDGGATRVEFRPGRTEVCDDVAITGGALGPYPAGEGTRSLGAASILWSRAADGRWEIVDFTTVDSHDATILLGSCRIERVDENRESAGWEVMTGGLVPFQLRNWQRRTRNTFKDAHVADAPQLGLTYESEVSHEVLQPLVAVRRRFGTFGVSAAWSGGTLFEFEQSYRNPGGHLHAIERVRERTSALSAAAELHLDFVYLALGPMWVHRRMEQGEFFPEPVFDGRELAWLAGAGAHTRIGYLSAGVDLAYEMAARRELRDGHSPPMGGFSIRFRGGLRF